LRRVVVVVAVVVAVVVVVEVEVGVGVAAGKGGTRAGPDTGYIIRCAFHSGGG
jgi:hypothetical protein